MIAPMIAPCIGPHIRSHAIGGPEWRISRPFMPGIASRASADASEHRLRREIGGERLTVRGFDRRDR